MADIFSKNRILFIKRYEHQKLVALGHIHAREIRLLELEEEVQRCQDDIAAQRKVIAEADHNIRLQNEEISKEATASASEQ